MNEERDFLGEVLAEDKEVRRPRTLSEMKPVQRLAHARGEALPPVTVINGLTAEVARLAEEVQALEHWRQLALQFDAHRVAALWHLKALLQSREHAGVVHTFLEAPPLAAHEVIAERDRLQGDLNRAEATIKRSVMVEDFNALQSDLAKAREVITGLVQSDRAFRALPEHLRPKAVDIYHQSAPAPKGGV